MAKLTVIARNRSYEVEPLDEGKRVIVNGVEHSVDFKEVANKVYSLILDGRSYDLHVEVNGERFYITHEGFEHEVLCRDRRLSTANNLRQAKVAGKSVLEIKAPMPGLVSRVRVKAGAGVEAGQGLIILEAMKMENEIRAPARGVVREVLVKEGVPVERGDTLLWMLV